MSQRPGEASKALPLLTNRALCPLPTSWQLLLLGRWGSGAMRPRGAGTWEDLLGPQNLSSLCFLDSCPCVWLGARMLAPRMCVPSNGWLAGTAQQPTWWIRSPSSSAEMPRVREYHVSPA